MRSNIVHSDSRPPAWKTKSDGDAYYHCVLWQRILYFLSWLSPWIVPEAFWRHLIPQEPESISGNPEETKIQPKTAYETRIRLATTLRRIHERHWEKCIFINENTGEAFSRALSRATDATTSRIEEKVECLHKKYLGKQTNKYIYKRDCVQSCHF